MLFEKTIAKRNAVGQERNALPFLVMVTVFGMTLIGCVTPPPITTTQSTDSAPVIALSDGVLVLEPLLTYEDVYNEAPLHPDAFGGDGIEGALFNSAKGAVVSGEYEVIEPDTIAGKISDSMSETSAEAGMVAPDEDEIIAEKRLMISNLSRGAVDDKLSTVLKTVCSDKNDRAVLASYVRVKVGSGGTWNSYTGAITTSNSTSVMQAALTQCNTGETLWRKQVLLRDVPKLGADKFSESIEMLYSNFPRKGEGQ